MKYAILTGVVSLGLLAGLAQAQEGNQNEITLSAFGVFQHSVNGNGVTQSSNDEPGGSPVIAFISVAIRGLNLIIHSAATIRTSRVSEQLRSTSPASASPAPAYPCPLIPRKERCPMYTGSACFIVCGHS